MKTMKRVLALLLCAVMMAALFAGCGSKTEPVSDEKAAAPQASGTNAQPEDQKLDHMEITVAYWDIERILKGDPILDKLQEKFNVEIVPMNVTWDDHGTKEQLWASTGSLPDVFACDFRNSSNFVQWARDGVIRALPDDLSKYPNLEAYMDAPAADGCVVDGHNYCIFRQTYGSQPETVKDRFIAYRWDLAQKAGITEKPTDWDSLRETLRAIIKADPEHKNIGGMTAPSSNYLTAPMFCYSMPNAVVGGAAFKWVDNGDGTYVPAYFAGENMGDAALPTWHLMRDMYKEGTIDHDIALATLEQSENKFLNGQAAAICLTNRIAGLGKNWEEIYGTSFTDDVAIMDLMPDVNGDPVYWALAYAWSESMFSSDVDDEKMDRILMIYDYLLSPEGVMECKFGVEGETYEIVDGKLQYIEGVVPTDLYPSVEMLGNLVAWTPPLPNGYTLPSPDPQWFQDRCAELVAQAEKCELPPTKPECTSAFISLGADFGLHCDDDALLIMTGDRPVEEMWQEIINDYKMEGLEDYIQQVNDAVK